MAKPNPFAGKKASPFGGGGKGKGKAPPFSKKGAAAAPPPFAFKKGGKAGK